MGAMALAITLVIRLYDNGALNEVDRAAAIASTSEILSASNIPTTWPECPPRRPGPTDRRPGPSDPALLICDRPMAATELAVRIVRGTTAPFKGDLPLGYSLIDMQQRRGALATIYLDRVEWIAADAGIDSRIVLGRAIAHEIGHLLLGTTEHSPRGLMREVWSRRTLERNSTADWQFSAAETATLQRVMLRALEGETWALTYHDGGF
jgi:hypothetical protein